MSDKVNSPLRILVQSLVVCEIGLGDKCMIIYPDHNNFEQLAEYNACNEQEATVVGSKSCDIEGLNSLELRLETGPKKGEIIRDVDPAHLRFIGVFVRASIAT